MFPLHFLVINGETSPITTVELEPLLRDVAAGHCSPFALVYEVNLASKSWLRAYQHQYLRPIVLARATMPGILTQIDWISPHGTPFATCSKEGFLAAVRDGVAIASTPITIHSTTGRFGATAEEILPREPADSWSFGKTLLALTAGATAVGLGIYGYQRYQHNHEIVDVRDPELRAELYARDHGICGLCDGRVHPSEFQLDHKHPRARGGEHTRANLHTAHPLCNQSKGAKTLNEYFEYLRTRR